MTQVHFLGQRPALGPKGEHPWGHVGYWPGSEKLLLGEAYQEWHHCPLQNFFKVL